MDSERLKHKAMLADMERRAGELRLEGKGRLRLLRDLLDPFEPDLRRLRLDEADVEFTRLRAIQAELSELGGRIRDLEEHLGQG